MACDANETAARSETALGKRQVIIDGLGNTNDGTVKLIIPSGLM